MWFRMNSGRCNASELGRILNVDNNITRKAFLNRKIKGLGEHMSYAMARGTHHEREAIEFVKKLYLDPEDRFSWRFPGSVYSATRVPVACSPDMLFGDSHSNFHGLEVKVPMKHNWPPPDELVLNIGHVLQCVAGIHCTGAQSWYLFYYSPEQKCGVLWRIWPHHELWNSWWFLEELQSFLEQLKMKKPAKYARRTYYKQVAKRKKIMQGLIYEGPLRIPLPPSQ